ncbi:MAG TPA: hypothetical protein VMU54_00500 [Planctomycetota bacterium]|nr:hypothetical protein [Planctomycetota bacterium]
MSKLVLLDLALLAIIVLASRLALVIHELGGHALPARALGATRIRIRLSPLGGGYVEWAFPPGTPSRAGKLLISLGGIALNLLTGAASWGFARRLKSRGLPYVALLFFGAGSVAGAVLYLGCGFYFGSGDPVGFAPDTEDISRVQGLWVVFLPVAGAVGWFSARHFSEFLEGRVRLDSPGRRIRGLFLTIGVSALAYGLLWLALHNPEVEGSTSKWRLQQEMVKEAARRSPPVPPEPPPGAPVRPVPPPVPVIVRPEEVADRVPPPIGPLLLYGITLLALLTALWRTHPGTRQPGEVPPVVALGLAGLSALVVAAFRFAG